MTLVHLRDGTYKTVLCDRMCSQGKMGTVKDAVEKRLGVDTRALAALRVSLALLILADLSMRARDLVVFYTDAGVLPRETQAEVFAPAVFSLHMLSGSVAVQAALFVVAALFALALLVGYRTRLVLAVCLVLLLSLHARNHFVLNAGDRLLRVTLFLCLFLPLGRRWSVDAYRKDRDGSVTVFSAGTAVFLLHVVLVYTANFLFKLRADGLWLTGDAVVHIMRMDRFTVLVGNHLADYGALLVAANWLWLVLLGGSVVLVLTAGRARVVAVAAYAGGHLGMLLTMRLGLFPLIAVAVLLPFLPSYVWDAVERRLPSMLSLPTRTRDIFDARFGDSGSRESRVDFSRLRRRFRHVVPALVVGFLLFTAFWQAVALGYASPPPVVGDDVDPSNHYSWSMFTVETPPVDRWFVATATLETGEAHDLSLFAETGAVDRPPDVGATYPSTLWHRHMSSLRFSGEAEQRAFVGYLCGHAGETHGDVREVTVEYVEQPTRTDGYAEAERVELITREC